MLNLSKYSVKMSQDVKSTIIADIRYAFFCGTEKLFAFIYAQILHILVYPLHFYSINRNKYKI